MWYKNTFNFSLITQSPEKAKLNFKLAKSHAALKMWNDIVLVTGT
jgi:hypothetical protein